MEMCEATINTVKVCATGVNGKPEDIIDNYAVPLFGTHACVDAP